MRIIITNNDVGYNITEQIATNTFLLTDMNSILCPISCDFQFTDGAMSSVGLCSESALCYQGREPRRNSSHL